MKKKTNKLMEMVEAMPKKSAKKPTKSVKKPTKTKGMKKGC